MASEDALFLDNQELKAPNWGFAVLRPSGEAVSIDDAQWKAAMDKIRSCVAKSAELEMLGLKMSGRLGVARPEDAIVASLDLHVVDLPLEKDEPAEWNEQMWNATRARFSQFHNERLRALEEDPDDFALNSSSLLLNDCLVLDAAIVEILASEQKTPEDCQVIAVDRDPCGRDRQRYPGWMRVEASLLRQLYQDLSAMSMDEICPHPWFQGQIPLYTDDFPGKLIDPPGGVGKSVGPPGTQRGLEKERSFWDTC